MLTLVIKDLKLFVKIEQPLGATYLVAHVSRGFQTSLEMLNLLSRSRPLIKSYFNYVHFIYKSMLPSHLEELQSALETATTSRATY